MDAVRVDIGNTFAAICKVGAYKADPYSDTIDSLLSGIKRYGLVDEFDGAAPSMWLKLPARPTEGILLIGTPTGGIPGTETITLSTGETVKVSFPNGGALPPAARVIAIGRIVEGSASEVELIGAMPL